MSGSYSSLKNKRTGEFSFRLIENMGDAHEACEMCFWMINYLAGSDKDLNIGDAEEAYFRYRRDFWAKK